jgi:hypothetical protein
VLDNYTEDAIALLGQLRFRTTHSASAPPSTVDLHIHNFTEDAILVNCSSKTRYKDLPREVLAVFIDIDQPSEYKSLTVLVQEY